MTSGVERQHGTLNLARIRLTSTTRLNRGAVRHVRDKVTRISARALFQLTHTLEAAPGSLTPTSCRFSTYSFSVGRVLAHCREVGPTSGTAFVGVTSIVLSKLRTHSTWYRGAPLVKYCNLEVPRLVHSIVPHVLLLCKRGSREDSRL